MVLLTLLGGVILLIAGAELLVRGASRIALAVGVAPLVVGLTVVAFGTSAPELAVSLSAAADGDGALAVGNVVGSNIFNVLVILGLSALAAPLVVAERIVRLDVPIMIVVALLLVPLALDGTIGRVEGALLVAAFIGYGVLQVLGARPAAASDGAGSAAPPTRSGLLRNGGLAVAGVLLLVLGSDWLVEGARAVARSLGVSDLVIGLTVVAAGTSLPELATSVVATLRGERDIAVGNVVGSNIFNILGILGLSSLLTPLEVPPAAVRFDIPFMIAVSIASLPIFFTGRRIARWEGALFVGYYVAYAAYLVMAAARHDMLPTFSMAMRYFVVPITVLTLGVLLVREWRAR